MAFKVDELLLNESYKFDLDVSDGNQKFFGRLDVSPEKITFTIIGETSEERRCSIGFGDIGKLVCTHINSKFILHDLKCENGLSRLITRRPGLLSFFEIVFDVGYLIYLPYGAGNDDKFSGLSIHSDTITKWIGITETQYEIIDFYHKNEGLFNNYDETTEFAVSIDRFGVIGAAYNLSQIYSAEDFMAGIVFPPFLFFDSCKEESSEELKEKYEKIINLLYLLTADEVLVKKIDVHCPWSRLNGGGSLYFPSKKIRSRRTSYAFFPLGKDLKHDTLCLPPLPMEALVNYFQLDEKHSQHWKKYIAYRRMENVEERFLGFFRLLESYCHKKKSYLNPDVLIKMTERIGPLMKRKFIEKSDDVKGFINGVGRYNLSKYNTERCIQDFFKEIPGSISSSWKFDKSCFNKICKLRNDITHANEYLISDNEIKSIEKFIEVLLLFSIFSKIGIDLSVTARLIDRLSGYYLIVSDKVAEARVERT